MTIKKAQELVQTVEIEEVDVEEQQKRTELGLEGYKWKEEIVNYGGIKQIWLVVESEKRRKSDLEKLERQLKEVAQPNFSDSKTNEFSFQGLHTKSNTGTFFF
jgi:hypothetical protein